MSASSRVTPAEARARAEKAEAEVKRLRDAQGGDVSKAKKKPSEADCGCIAGVQELLAKTGESMDLAVSFNPKTGKTATKIHIAMRSSKRILLPSFCPFCGVEVLP